MFGIFTLFYSLVFFLNGLVILDDKRFLSRIKLPLSQEYRPHLTPSAQKIVDLINAARMVFEFPLILLDLCYALYEIFLG